MSNELNIQKIAQLEQIATEQQDKIRMMADIIKMLKATGTIANISDEDLSKLTLSNVMSNTEVAPSMIQLNQPKKRSSFFSMIATHLHNTSNLFSFKKENNFSWENLGFKLGVKVGAKVRNINNSFTRSNEAYGELKEILHEQSGVLGVKVKESKFITTAKEMLETITLIGTKRDIYKLNKKFKKDLNLLGFEVEDLFQKSESHYPSKVEMSEKINEKLYTNLKLSHNDNQYSFDILNGLSQESKLNMIKKVIWPVLSRELGQNLELAFTISDVLKYKNKDIQALTNFCNKNDMHSDIVIHALKEHPEILKDSPGYQQLIKDKDNILLATEKYGNLIDNNTLVTRHLLMAVDLLKEELNKINSSESQIFMEEVNNHVIASKKNKENNVEVIYTIPILNRNIMSIMSNTREEETESRKKMQMAA